MFTFHACDNFFLPRSREEEEEKEEYRSTTNYTNLLLITDRQIFNAINQMIHLFSKFYNLLYRVEGVLTMIPIVFESIGLYGKKVIAARAQRYGKKNLVNRLEIV